MIKYFLLPINTGYYFNGLPTKECIDFYKTRMSEKLYCAIIGNVVVTNGFSTNRKNGKIVEDKKWSKLSNVIKNKGVKPGIQLSTTWEGFEGQKKFLNDDWNNYENKIVSMFKNYNADNDFNNLENSILISKKNGFEHVQIHAAHGYLISALLDPYYFTNSLKIVNKLLKLNKYAISLKMETSIRISLFCGLDSEREKKELQY